MAVDPTETAEAIVKSVIEAVAPDEIDDLDDLWNDWKQYDEVGARPVGVPHGSGVTVEHFVVATIVMPVVVELVKSGVKAGAQQAYAMLRARYAKGAKDDEEKLREAANIIAQALNPK